MQTVPILILIISLTMRQQSQDVFAGNCAKLLQI